MCAGCGFPAVAGHWTDAGAGSTPAARIRLRLVRLGAINRMLAPFGIKAHDDGMGMGIQLFAPSGAREIVANLEDLWPMAEKMAKRAIDPLARHHG